MPWYRYLLRLAVVLGSCLAVTAAMVAAFAAIALAIDWDIPEPTELLGPSSVFDRNGVPLARLAAHVERRPVPLGRISPHLQHAVIAVEDHRFYEHQGVDPISVVRAIVSNVRHGGIREGGSTLTQQFVKNVYVGSDRTFNRKVREAVVALQLEKELTKEEILEAYLNRVYFGDGAYGAEAAALTYFRKAAADLTAAEAAILAGVLTAPSRFSPRSQPELALARRDLVLDRMARHGFLTREEADRYQRARLGIVPREEPDTAAPFFVAEVRRQLLETYGAELVYNGGLRITASIDLELQAALEQEVRRHIPDDPRFDAGVAVVDPATGDVLAAWSGRDFDSLQVDLALSPFFGRPSGSTFKVFALAAALEQGMTLETAYPAPGQVTIGDWSVRGGGRCPSPCTLHEAIVRSSNTVFAQLARDLGAEAFLDTARRMGVRRPLDPDAHGAMTNVLGTADVSPLDLASALATLANDGVACPARVVTDVRDPDDISMASLPDPRSPGEEERDRIAARLRDLGYDFGEEDLGRRCYRAVAPSVARTVTQALEGVIERGTGRAARIDRPAAGKTGTAQRNAEVWFAGYTPHLSIAVAFFDPRAQTPLTEVPGCGRACFGGQLPAQIWHDVALALHAGRPAEPFPEPGDDERVGRDRRRPGDRMERPEPEPEETEEPPAFEDVAPLPDEDGPPPSPPPPRPEPSPSPSPSPGGQGVLPPILPTPRPPGG